MTGPLTADSTPTPEPKPRPFRRLVIMLLILIILLGAVFGWGALRSMFVAKFLASLKDKPQTVSAMQVVESKFSPEITATGNLVAIQGTSLSAQVAGIVDTIDFTSGTDITKGQVLLTLRPNNDPAILAQLQAAADLAAITYKRDLAQYQAKAVSLQTVDADRANLDSARAQVSSQKELMAEKIIRAPFSGRIGIRAVSLGQYLAAGTAIASLQQLDPIDVDFYVPQADLAAIKPGMKITVTVGGFGNKTFDGTIKALNSSISTQTLMVQVRGEMRNPGDELRPGAFARIAIVTGEPKNFITLPKTAITYNPYGDTVYLVEKQTKDGKTVDIARQLFVTLGETRGDQVAVTKGLKPGETVVTAGQLKLHSGSIVNINNAIKLPNSPNPTVPLY